MPTDGNWIAVRVVWIAAAVLSGGGLLLGPLVYLIGH
jgi:hypothetical protein